SRQQRPALRRPRHGQVVHDQGAAVGLWRSRLAPRRGAEGAARRPAARAAPAARPPRALRAVHRRLELPGDGDRVQGPQGGARRRPGGAPAERPALRHVQPPAPGAGALRGSRGRGQRRAARRRRRAGEAVAQRPVRDHADVPRPGPGALPGDRQLPGDGSRAADRRPGAAEPGPDLGDPPQGPLGPHGAPVRRLLERRAGPGRRCHRRAEQRRVSSRLTRRAEMRAAVVRCRERVDRLVRVVRAGGSLANGSARDGATRTTADSRGPRGAAGAAPALPPASGTSTLRLTPGWLIGLGTVLVGAAQLLGLGLPALGLLLAGGGLFLAGVYRSARGTAVVFPRPRLRRRRAVWLLGAFASVSAAVALLQLLPSSFAGAPEVLLESARQPPFWHVAALWVVGLVCYAAAFVDHWPRGWWRRLWAEHRRETLATGGLLLLGLAVRVGRLDSFPRNFGGDEGSQALSALAVLRGTLTNMFETGWYGTPTLFYFLQAVPMAVIADPVVGSRLAPALVGVGALAVMYFLARSLFGVLVALVALAFLATYDYHV